MKIAIQPTIIIAMTVSLGAEPTPPGVMPGVLQLPAEMQYAVAQKSGGAMSARQGRMIVYHPIAQITLRPYAALTAMQLPMIKPAFFKQIEWLLDTAAFYDGPNYNDIAVKGVKQFSASDDYDVYGGSGTLESALSLFEVTSGKTIGTTSIANCDIGAIAIAPQKNDLVAYANGNKISLWDFKDKKEIEVAVAGAPVQRLQLDTAQRLYVLSDKKLYVAQLPSTAGTIATLQEQMIKDAQGNGLYLEDIVLNKSDANLGAIVTPSALYIFNNAQRKFKKVSDLPIASRRRLAFYENQIAVVSTVNKEGQAWIDITIIEPSLYSME